MKGLEMTAIHWTAFWITADWQRDADPMRPYHVLFRKDLVLPSSPDLAILRIAAFPRYHLWINGQLLGFGPPRSYPAHQLYDQIDITPYCTTGTNTLAFLLEKPSGVTGYSLTGRMGIFVDGTAHCSGESIPIRSDTTWLTRDADWYLDTPWRWSLPVGPQEHVLGTRLLQSWQTSVPASSEGWHQAFCLGDHGTPPWKELRPAITLRNRELPCQGVLVWRGRAECESGVLKLENPAIRFNTLPLEGSTVPVMKIDDIDSCGNLSSLFSYQGKAGGTGVQAEGNERYSTLVDGTGYTVSVYDFGSSRYLRPGLTIRNCAGQVRLELYYDIEPRDPPKTMTGFGGSNEGACDSFEPPTGASEWTALTPRGCRYIVVRCTGEGTCNAELTVRSVEYPYPEARLCPAPAPFLSRLWQLSADTLRAATTDVISEPVRENVLWTFDACVGGKAAFHTFGDTAMWRHCLELIADGIDPEGAPNSVVPAGYSFMVLIDQALYWLHSCREYVELTNDRGLADQVLPAAGRLLGLCERHMTDDNLFVPPGYAWHWVDWGRINKSPYSMPINALLFAAAEAVTVLAQHSISKMKPTHDLPKEGKERSSALIEIVNLATRIEERLRLSLLRFWDDQEFCFRTVLPADRSFPTNGLTSSRVVDFDVHSNALACLCCLGTDDQRRGAARKIADLIEHDQAERTMPEQLFGIGWTELILTPLFDYGLEKEGLQAIRKYFGPLLELGTRTWGEDFSPTIYNTAHGWGACVNSLIAERLSTVLDPDSLEDILH